VKGRRIGRWWNLKSGDGEAQAGGADGKAPTLARARRHRAGSLGGGSSYVSSGIVGKYFENLCKESRKFATGVTFELH
jgi:hypothetical protein